MSSVFTISRSIAAALLLFGCTKQQDSANEPTAAATTERQEVIQALARNIKFYHKSDAKAAQPGWQDGGIYSFSNGPGRKAKTFQSRVAMRAELNRMLDSLKSTGPLTMGNQAEETDTIPSQPDPNAISTSTSTSTVTSWQEGDSAATVRVRKLRADSTAPLK